MWQLFLYPTRTISFVTCWDMHAFLYAVSWTHNVFAGTSAGYHRQYRLFALNQTPRKISDIPACSLWKLLRIKAAAYKAKIISKFTTSSLYMISEQATCRWASTFRWRFWFKRPSCARRRYASKRLYISTRIIVKILIYTIKKARNYISNTICTYMQRNNKTYAR